MTRFIETIIDEKGLHTEKLSALAPSSSMSVRLPAYFRNSANFDRDANFNSNNIVNIGTINGVDVTTLSGSVIPANVRIVAKSGGQFTTINAALSASNSGDAIVVYPGTYLESFEMLPNRRVIGYPASQAVIISGSSPTGARVVFNSSATLREVTVVGPESGNAPAIDATGLSAGELAILFNLPVRGGGSGHTGPLVEGAGSGILGMIEGFFHNGGTTSGPVVSGSGGTIVGLDWIANVGSASHFIKNDGAVIRLQNVQYQDSTLYNCTIGMEIKSGEIDAQSILTPTSGSDRPTDIGLKISGEGVRLELSDAVIEGTVNDILVDNTLTGVGTSVELNSCAFRYEKLGFPAAFAQTASIIATFSDIGIENDPQYNIIGSTLSVGSPDVPTESAFGEGNSNVFNMVCFKSSSATGFEDVTAQMKDSTSGSVAFFDEVTSGSAFYIGSLNRRFPNIKLNLVDAGLTGSGEIGFEYMSGTSSTWKDLKFLATDADAPYTQRARRLFDTQTDKQIRFDVDEANSTNWLSGTVNGTDAYWVRMVVQSGITSPATASRIKLGTNRVEINKDGFTELFGSAEKQRQLPDVSLTQVQDLQGASPGNGTIDISPNITLTPVDNVFAGNATDGFGQLLSLPFGVDTSRDIIFRLGFYPTSDIAGDVKLDFIQTEEITEGTSVNAGNASEIITGITASIPSNASNTLRIVDIPFKLDRQNDKKLWAYALRRVGSSDSYGGSIVLAFISADAYYWSL